VKYLRSNLAYLTGNNALMHYISKGSATVQKLKTMAKTLNANAVWCYHSS